MIAETCQELLVLFRQDVHDYGSYAVAQDDSDKLWKDAEILGYMTESCDALARATYGLREIARIGYLAGAETVELPAHILDIISARLVTNNSRVLASNADGAGAPVNDYGVVHERRDLFVGTGTPCEYVRDYDVGMLRLVPIPVVADTLELSCYVTIENPLEAEDDVPFTDAVDLRLILEHMKFIAYRKQDAETEDLVRSKSAKAFYDEGSMERRYEIQRQRRVPGVMRMAD